MYLHRLENPKDLGENEFQKPYGYVTRLTYDVMVLACALCLNCNFILYFGVNVIM